MNWDDLKSEFIPAIVNAFHVSMECAAECNTRGAGCLYSLTKGVRVSYSFGPHRDKSGDITFFVTIEGYDLCWRPFANAVREASGLRYLYAKQARGRKATLFFATYSMTEIKKIVAERSEAK